MNKIYEFPLSDARRITVFERIFEEEEDYRKHLPKTLTETYGASDSRLESYPQGTKSISYKIGAYCKNIEVEAIPYEEDLKKITYECFRMMETVQSIEKLPKKRFKPQEYKIVTTFEWEMSKAQMLSGHVEYLSCANHNPVEIRG